MAQDEIRLKLQLDTTDAVGSVGKLDRELTRFIRKGGSDLPSLNRHLNKLEKDANNLAGSFQKLLSKNNPLFTPGRLNQWAQGGGKFGTAFKGLNEEAAAQKALIEQINARLKEGLATKIDQYKAMQRYRSVAEEIYQIERSLDRDRQLERYTGMRLDPNGLNRSDLMRRKDELDTLANTRYALYDAAKTYLTLATAIAAPGIAVVKFSADYQKALASVRRVTGESAESFRDLGMGLVDLTTKMPVTVQEISRIATVGGQLGVATENLANFTGVVAMFTSTTGVSAEEAAKGLGRFAQLTQTSGAAYENLGSAIYQVGVQSVATEHEILNLASEIATSADLAGFANHEIVGLAGTLASLGVKPEAARGSLMRIFDTITRGAADGGEALQKISDISGMSAEQIQENWGTNSQTVFNAFVEGLGRAQDAGENTNAMLKDLGINAVRDIRTLQILANNTELYADLLHESNSAYASGNALRAGFAVQIDNLVDKMQMLWQTLTAVAAEAGGAIAPALSKIVDAMSSLAQMALEFVRTPLGQNLVALGAILSVVVGSLLTWQGIMILLKASVAAMITSTAGLREAAGTLNGTFRELVMRLFEAGRGLAGVAAGAGPAAAGLNQVGGAAGNASIAMTNTQKVIGVLGKTLKAAGWTAALLLALDLLAKVGEAIGESMKTNTDRANEFFGGFESLSNAIKQDTATWRETGEAIRTLTTNVDKSTTSLSAGARALNEATGGQINFETAVKDTTTAVESQTLALGEQTRAAVANALASNDAFMKLYGENQRMLAQAGFNMKDYVDSLLQGTGAEYLTPILERLKVLIRETYSEAGTLSGNLMGSAAGGEITFNRLSREGEELLVTVQNLLGATSGFDSQFEAMAAKEQLLAEAGVAVAGSMDEVGEGVGSVTERFREMGGSLDQVIQIQDAFAGLSDAIAENGYDFDQYSAKGIDNLRALQDTVSTLADAAGDDGAAFAANIGGILAQMQGEGVVVGDELQYLLDLMNTTFGTAWGLDFNSEAARNDIRAFIAQAIAALEMRAMLEREALNDPGLGYAAQVAGAQKLTATEAQLARMREFQKGVNQSYENSQRAVTRAREEDTKAAKRNAGANRDNAKEVRTLSDYMRDLETVTKNAFEFRFGLDQAARKLREVQRSMKGFDVYEDLFSKRLFDAAALASGTDEIIETIASMRDEFDKAADRIQEAARQIQETMASLADNAANKQIAQYRLSVAELYGDELRAAELRAELAKIDAERVKLQSDLNDAYEEQADAQDATSRSLTGNSAASIRNRKNVKKLLQEYLDYVETLSDSGASQSDLNAALNDAREDFLREAEAMGFSRAELMRYAQVLAPVTTGTKDHGVAADQAAEKMEELTKAWQDYILELQESGAPISVVRQAIKDAKADIENQGRTLGLSKTQVDKYKSSISDLAGAIAKIPKDLTVNANLSPLERALAEWRAKNSGGKGLSKGIGVDFSPNIKPLSTARENYYKYLSLFLQYSASYSKTGSQAALNNMKEYERLMKAAKSAGWMGGGYTGAGAANQVAGVVHRGEYVFRKDQVDQRTGLPYLDAFMQVARGYQGGGYVSQPAAPRIMMPARQEVELSPTDRALLAAAGNVTILADGRVIAQVVNDHNRTNNVRGDM